MTDSDELASSETQPYQYHDSDDDTNDLDDTPSNNQWKVNKTTIEQTFATEGLTPNLINYGNN
jgi:hypothetical protein